MAITVKLNDATISLGGDFAGALALVKSITGRCYDATNKTWTVPQDLKTFSSWASGLPFDVLSGPAHRSGEHVTCWGTRYARNEWDAKTAKNNIQVPDALADEAHAKRDAAEQALDATLRSFGMDDRAIARLRGLYTQFAGDLGEAEEYGRIQFSSAERRAAVEIAFETYYRDWLKADEAVEDFIAAEERRIDEAHGVY